MTPLDSEQELRLRLVEYLGLAGTLFNSGQIDRSRFRTEQNEEKVSLVHTWFLPPKSRHAGGQTVRIGCWILNKNDFLKLDIEEFGPRPAFIKEVTLFLPETLTESWKIAINMLGEPHKVYTGYMTSGGRSFWVVGLESCFGIKFDTLSAKEEDLITKRSLDEQMLRNTVYVSEKLNQHKEAAVESYGSVLRPKQRPDVCFSYLIRDFKWNKIQPIAGDVLLPISVLLSEAFWRLEDLQKQMQIDVGEERDIKGWFIDNIANFIAETIHRAIFETGIHPEMHQQNLTAHLREGRVIGLYFHDLQDCFLDPMTMFLNESLVEGKINPSSLGQRRMLGFPGEIMTRFDPEKLYISTADWWRRWLRVFGQYDRVLNILNNEEPFLRCDFEEKVRDCLHQLLLSRELSDVNTEYDLYQTISWATYKHQQQCVQKFLQQNESLLVAAGNEMYFNEKKIISQLRAPWSAQMLEAWCRRQKKLKTFKLEGSQVLLNQQRIAIFCGDEESFLYWIEED